MKKITFILEQHTPLLHFQGSQYNATLRASDVKPRFDRWLIKKAFCDDYEKCKTFLVGYGGNKEKDLKDKFNAGFRALNYKMRVVQVGESMIGTSHKTNDRGKKVSSLPAYFGNEITTVHVKDNVRIEFIFNGMTEDVLCEKVESNFGEFIGSQNFGTRSSKGYGSFTVQGAGPLPYIGIDMNQGTAKTWKDVLSQLDLFYKTLRSGINATRKLDDKDKKEGYYFKSMLYSYVEKKYNGVKRWDKKVIKNHFIRRGQQSISDEKKIDVRDFLGLSTSEMWGKYNMAIAKEIENISRFSSPIVFKPVKENGVWKVYIIIHSIPDGLKGSEIVVKGKIAREDRPSNGLISKIESNPLKGMRMAQEFSVEEYFDYLFLNKPENVNKSDWMGAMDIRNRFEICEECNKNKKTQIEQIVYIYKKLREAYKNKR